MHSLSFLLDVYHHYPDFSIHITFFEGLIDNKQITLSDHRKILWLSTNELKSLDWAEANLPVVDLLCNNYLPKDNLGDNWGINSRLIKIK